MEIQASSEIHVTPPAGQDDGVTESAETVETEPTETKPSRKPRSKPKRTPPRKAKKMAKKNGKVEASAPDKANVPVTGDVMRLVRKLRAQMELDSGERITFSQAIEKAVTAAL